MYKKHFLVIFLSQLMVPISLILPVLKVEETRIRFGGVMVADSMYVNIFEYLSHDVYLTIGIIMITLAMILVIACLNSLIAINEPNNILLYAKLSFFYSLATAIMGAFAAGVNSYIFSLICGASFVVNSILSIRVIKRVM